MPYSPLPDGVDITFLEMSPEINTRLQAIWDALGGSSGGGIRSHFTIPYLLYKGAYAGNIHFQLIISKNADFSSPEYELDTGTSQDNWYCFTGEEWIALPGAGMPTTFPQAVISGLTFADTDIRFVRWRAYYDSTFGDWVGGII